MTIDSAGRLIAAPVCIVIGVVGAVVSGGGPGDSELLFRPADAAPYAIGRLLELWSCDGVARRNGNAALLTWGKCLVVDGVDRDAGTVRVRIRDGSNFSATGHPPRACEASDVFIDAVVDVDTGGGI